MDRSALPYWESGHAGPVRRMAEPIVPSAEDIGFVEAEAAGVGAGRGIDALLLGTTRGLASMRWPAGTSLVAVEWSAAMIRRFWPSDGMPAAAGMVRADWRELPLATGSCDFVAGDGCYSVLASLNDARLVNREVRRVLRPGGLFCMRCFARPAGGSLTVQQVFDELAAGRVGNIFLLQWLLAMAVHGETREGVPLDAVWRAWRANVARPEELLARHGWPADCAWTLERWRGVGVRYSFPTEEELRDAAAPFFDRVERRVPGYAWAERFPTFIMRAAAR